MIRPVLTNLLCAAAIPALALAAMPARADTPVAEPAAETWGTFGIQTETIDREVRPGDDFNRYVNGKWLKKTEIPADKTRYGSFDQLNDLSLDRLHAILDGLVASKPAPGTDAARIADTYSAFLDQDAIDKAGLTPARPYLDQIYAAKTPQDLMRLFALPGYASPLGATIDADQKQSDRYALYTYIGGLGLPDRDYYIKDTEQFRSIREKYVDYLAYMLDKAGYEDSKSAAKAVMALETQIARTDWDRAAGRDDTLTYNKMTMADYEKLAPAGLVRSYFEALGAGDARYVIAREIMPTEAELKTAEIPAAQVPALFGGGQPATLKLVQDVPLATWQAYLAAHFLSDHAAFLPRAIDDRQFAFYGTTLRGQPTQRPRWKRGIGVVESQIGELLGKLYAEKYYPPEQKAAMADMIVNLRKAMAVNLKDLKWMGAATRKEAQVKLDAFTPKIGAPDEFKKYEGLSVSPDNALGNAMAAARWQSDFQVNRIGKPVDKAEWGMLPQTINAYYNQTNNEIVFPAAILQPPFFNLTADPAVNYGGIGAVIGHEMGHGFDDQGSASDAVGNLRDWWTAADKANFRKLQDKLAAQYGKFCPFDEGKTCVNPKLTMGENIGDLGGLSMAYRAYRLSLDGKEAPVIDGFTGDQRFFMAWAQVWRQKIREARERELLVADPHAPAQYRINGIVRNFDEWYKAFDVKPGDELYLPPEERVRIW